MASATHPQDDVPSLDLSATYDMLYHVTTRPSISYAFYRFMLILLASPFLPPTTPCAVSATKGGQTMRTVCYWEQLASSTFSFSRNRACPAALLARRTCTGLNEMDILRDRKCGHFIGIGTNIELTLQWCNAMPGSSNSLFFQLNVRHSILERQQRIAPLYTTHDKGMGGTDENHNVGCALVYMVRSRVTRT